MGCCLKGGVISHCAESVSAMLADEASFEGIFDALQQSEEEEQAKRAEQEGAGDLLGDAERSVTSSGHTEAAMPIVDLFAV
jgi:hypothetical protein